MELTGMQKFLLRGLVASLAAGAALALAAPSFAAPVHRGHTVIHGGHGFHNPRAMRVHRFAPGHFNRLTVVQRDRWRGGHWWHGNHHGRIGWWWNTGGLWYWYAQPVYPYPTYISTTASYDYAPRGYSENSWYYCDDPQGYYPYVRSCSSDWRPVPISPQARVEAHYGAPPQAQGDYDDDSYQGDDEENYDQDDDMDNEDDRY